MREGWVRKSISEICDKASSNIAQNKIADIDGDYPVYGASGYVQNVDFYHRDTDYIGIVKDGSGVGRVNVYPAYSSLLGTMQYIIPKDGYLLGYVAYALKGLNLSSFASGAAIPHIYFKDYGKCKIDVPPLSEQQRIVSELDLLSSIIEKKKAQLKEYDQLAQSIFYDMFGDPVTNEKGWEVKKLGEVCALKAGKAIKASELKDKADNLFPCYGGNGIRGYIDKISHKTDLPIIGRQGALCGNVNYAIAPFYATEHAVVVSPKIELETKWLYNVLKYLRLEQYAHGVAQPGIAVNDLNPIFLPLPPLPLQQSFASKIEAIERQKALIQQSIAEVQMLFDSRMDDWFA